MINYILLTHQFWTNTFYGMHWSFSEVQLSKLRVFFRRITALYIAVSSKTDGICKSVFEKLHQLFPWWIISPMMTGGGRNKGTGKERKRDGRERSEVSPAKSRRKLRGQLRPFDYTEIFFCRPYFRFAVYKNEGCFKDNREMLLAGYSFERPGVALRTRKAKKRGGSGTIKHHWNIARYILHGPIPFCLWSLRILNRW